MSTFNMISRTKSLIPCLLLFLLVPMFTQAQPVPRNVTRAVAHAMVDALGRRIGNHPSLHDLIAHSDDAKRGLGIALEMMHQRRFDATDFSRGPEDLIHGLQELVPKLDDPSQIVDILASIKHADDWVRSLPAAKQAEQALELQRLVQKFSLSGSMHVRHRRGGLGELSVIDILRRQGVLDEIEPSLGGKLFADLKLIINGIVHYGEVKFWTPHRIPAILELQGWRLYWQAFRYPERLWSAGQPVAPLNYYFRGRIPTVWLEKVRDGVLRGLQTPMPKGPGMSYLQARDWVTNNLKFFELGD